MGTYELQLFIDNIEEYCDNIKKLIEENDLSFLEIDTIYFGLMSIITQLRQYAKFLPAQEKDIALEKLYNLQTIVEIYLDEMDLF